jgi:WD40 repeat protein
VESLENQTQVFHSSHRPWKSLRDFHIPTASTTRSLFIGEAKIASPKNQQLRVGQIKPPKWAKYSCQTQRASDAPKNLDIYLDKIYERVEDDFFEKTIKPALANSKYLVVVQTPGAVDARKDGQKNWVVQELEYFQSLPQGGNICIALAKGGFEDPLPGGLHERFSAIERVDIRRVGQFGQLIGDHAILPLIARLYGVSDENRPRLAREEEQVRSRRLLRFITAGISVLIVIATLGGIAWWQRGRAQVESSRANREAQSAKDRAIEAAAETKIAQEQQAIAVQQARIASSRQYAAEAVNLIENRLDEAILRAVKAVTTEQTFEARNSLFQALSYTPEIEAFLYRRRVANEPPGVFVFSPNGREVALATPGVIKLITRATNDGPIATRVRLTFRGIESMAFSHNGSTLAVGGTEGLVSIVNTSHGTQIGAPLNISGRPVDRLFFSTKDDQIFAVSDGKVLRLSISNRSLSLVETARIGDPALKFGSGSENKYRVYYATANTSDGRFLIVGSHTKVAIWDLSGPVREHYSFDVPHQFTVAIKELAVTSDGGNLAIDLTAGSDGIPVNFLELYSVGSFASQHDITFKRQLTLLTHKYLFDTPRLSFNTEGDRLLIGEPDGLFHLVNWEALEKRTAERDQGSPTASTEIIDTTKPILPAESNYVVSPISVKGLAGNIYNPTFAPHRYELMFGVGPHIVLWKSDPQLFSRILLAGYNSLDSVAFSKDDGALVSVTDQGLIYRWRMSGGKPEIRGTAIKGVKSALLAEGAHRLMLVMSNRMSLIDTITGRELQHVALEGWRPLAMSPDAVFVAQFRHGVLRVFDLVTPKETWTARLYDNRQMEFPPVRDPGISFSKSGTKMLYQTFGESKLMVRDASSGRVEAFDAGATRDWDWAPVLSDDGKWIATAADNSSLMVINTQTRENTRIEAPGTVCSVTFSPRSPGLAIGYERDEVSSEDAGDARFHPADYGVFFWDLDRRQREAPNIKVPSSPCRLAFNRDGDLLAIATQAEEGEAAQITFWAVEPSRWAERGLAEIFYV